MANRLLKPIFIIMICKKINLLINFRPYSQTTKLDIRKIVFEILIDGENFNAIPLCTAEEKKILHLQDQILFSYTNNSLQVKQEDQKWIVRRLIDQPLFALA